MSRAKSSPIALALIAGCFTVAGALLGRLDVIRIGGGPLDKPTAKLHPRQAVCFFHKNSPPGYRLLQRQDNGGWIETQPDGMQYHHIEEGRVTHGPFQGVVLKRVENPVGQPWPVELFVPDDGASNVLLYRPDPKASWEYAGIIEQSTAGCPRTGP